MNTQQPIEQDTGRAIWRQRWLLVCVFAIIAIVLSFGQPVQANNGGLPYVTAAVDIGSDCDGHHAIAGSHCCAGVACAGYAQHETDATASDLMPGNQLLPAIQLSAFGQTLRPSPQPPRA
jgi:hypothetical protein